MTLVISAWVLISLTTWMLWRAIRYLWHGQLGDAVFWFEGATYVGALALGISILAYL